MKERTERLEEAGIVQQPVHLGQTGGQSEALFGQDRVPQRSVRIGGT